MFVCLVSEDDAVDVPLLHHTLSLLMPLLAFANIVSFYFVALLGFFMSDF